MKTVLTLALLSTSLLSATATANTWKTTDTQKTASVKAYNSDNLAIYQEKYGVLIIKHIDITDKSLCPLPFNIRFPIDSLRVNGVNVRMSGTCKDYGIMVIQPNTQKGRSYVIGQFWNKSEVTINNIKYSAKGFREAVKKVVAI